MVEQFTAPEFHDQTNRDDGFLMVIVGTMSVRRQGVRNAG